MLIVHNNNLNKHNKGYVMMQFFPQYSGIIFEKDTEL